MAAGKVQTVLGLLEPSQLGNVLMHEHILVDARPLSVPAPSHAPKDLASLPFDMASLGHIRQFPYSHMDNLMCFSDEVSLAELKWFLEAGGSTIVDVTTRGIGIEAGRRNGERMASLSRLSGVNIVCGAGFYVGSTHSESLIASSVEEIAKSITLEITQGIDGSGIKAGLIGEIGCSWPLRASEIKVLQASALAQRHTGATIMVHPGRHESAPMQIVDILREAGADLSRVIIAHIDRTLYTLEALHQLADSGVVVELDLFGNEVSYYQLNDALWMRSDEERIGMVQQLLARHARVLLSHDIHTKHRMRSFGGHGYAYILECIVPRLLTRGVTQSQIHTMLCELPQQLLTLGPCTGPPP